MYKKRIGYMAVVLSSIMSALVSAQDEDVVELSATVTGNQEQPKVIYIVPWKPATDDSILYQPLNSKTDNIFGHVEPSEHKRELIFIRELERE
ncbi:hypothetical protein [Teredinibacter haidensis]|uniref:hypothetical protein n=1 Tax=Teredinibacter haidensis TaxID=2731755 RepID=UPI000A622D65|nr:hypothetical protein [Teredinibacter haidensis]